MFTVTETYSPSSGTLFGNLLAGIKISVKDSLSTGFLITTTTIPFEILST